MIGFLKVPRVLDPQDALKNKGTLTKMLKKKK